MKKKKFHLYTVPDWVPSHSSETRMRRKFTNFYFKVRIPVSPFPVSYSVDQFSFAPGASPLLLTLSP